MLSPHLPVQREGLAWSKFFPNNVLYPRIPTPLSDVSCFIHMWQSRVEFKHYSVMNFDCITAFETL